MSLAARNARKGVGKSIASDMILSSSAFIIAVYPKHRPGVNPAPLAQQGPGHTNTWEIGCFFFLPRPLWRVITTAAGEAEPDVESAKDHDGLWVVVAEKGSIQ